jgi:hypothetical protein
VVYEPGRSGLGNERRYVSQRLRISLTSRSRLLVMAGQGSQTKPIREDPREAISPPMARRGSLTVG